MSVKKVQDLRKAIEAIDAIIFNYPDRGEDYIYQGRDSFIGLAENAKLELEAVIDSFLGELGVEEEDSE